jgi:hypothetical protein
LRWFFENLRNQKVILKLTDLYSITLSTWDLSCLYHRKLIMLPKENCFEQGDFEELSIIKTAVTLLAFKE